MVLALRVLLSDKKSLEMAHMPKMEVGMRNQLDRIFKYAKVRGRNKKKELECPSVASVKMSYHNYYLSASALRSYIRIGVTTSGYHRHAVMVNNFSQWDALCH